MCENVGVGAALFCFARICLLFDSYVFGRTDYDSEVVAQNHAQKRRWSSRLEGGSQCVSMLVCNMGFGDCSFV